MHKLILLPLLAIIFGQCKLKSSSKGDVKVDTTNTLDAETKTRTGVSNEQDIELQWNGASTGTLQNPNGNIYMYVQPVLCVLEPQKNTAAKCTDILREKSRDVLAFEETPVKVGGEVINPMANELIKGKELNDAAETLFTTAGYGNPGDFQLGFKIFVKSTEILFPTSKLVDFGMIPLQGVDPQTQITIRNREYSSSGVTASILFTKVANLSTGGAVGTRMKWGLFTADMRKFLGLDDDPANINSKNQFKTSQQNFFNQELAFYKQGYDRIDIMNVYPDTNGVPNIVLIYTDETKSKCLRVTQPEGLFTETTKLKSEEISCK